MREQRLWGRQARLPAPESWPQKSVAGLFFDWLTRRRVSFLIQVWDIVSITSIALLLLPLARQRGESFPPNYLSAILAITALAHYSFFRAGLYEIDCLMAPIRAIRAAVLRWTSVFVVMAALAALTHQPGQYSRLWFGGLYVSGIAVLAATRWLTAGLIREWIRLGHHIYSVALVGNNELAEKFIQKFKQNQFGIKIIGVFDDRTRAPVASLRMPAKHGTIADLLSYAQIREVDLVVVTLPIAATARIQAVIHRLRQQPLNVRLLPGAIGLERISPMRLSRSELPGVQLISIADRPISEFALFAKGVMDRMGAALAVILLSPIFLVCAACIKLTSKGPVLFRQKRIGYKGRDFYILKFRTMHVQTAPNLLLTRRNDPRIFKFGSFMRRLSLDELPQLFNVLKGEMSLVGPRPHMPEARADGRLYFDAVSEYANRQRVKPGITGWAQVNGWRGPTETLEQIERRVECDIYYIDNWSLLLDFIIIFRTVLHGFYGRNAF
jgi:Undecaprenyl-phosphate glucose phosphotransferase